MNKQHTDIFSETECLSLETIYQYINDQLSASERQHVEKHLIDCELCSDALDGITASGDMASVATSVEVLNKKVGVAAHKPFFGSFQENYAKYAAVAAVVLIVFGSVFVLIKDKFKDSNELIVENISPVQQEEESFPVAGENKTKEEQSPSGPALELSAGRANAHESSTVPTEAGTNQPMKNVTTKRRGFNEADKTLKKTTEASPVQPADLSGVTRDRKAGGSILSSDMATAREEFDVAGTMLDEETRSKDEDIETEGETTIESTLAFASGEADDLLADETPAPEEEENRALNAQVLAKGETKLPMKSDDRLSSDGDYMRTEKSKSKKRSQARAAYGGMAPITAKEPEVAEDKSDEITEIVPSAAAKLTGGQEAFSIVEEMPQFGEGDSALHVYLSDNIKYPATAQENGIEGTVYLTFVISSKGEVTNVKIVRGIGGGCDEEAVRVVENMPDWIPGKQKGKSVPVQYQLPVQFKL